MGVVGKINFHPNPNPTALTNTVQILPETCYLSVVGEKNSPKYTLIQGVDIASTESLSLTCSVVSPLKTISSVVPTYETHYRDISGEVVTQEGGDVSPISFKALEKKLITLLLPKATKPQAYDIKTTLISNGISSNSIISHYVLRGESATIQTFSIDKDYYKVNDIAKLSVVWTPSADNFIGSRLSKSGTALPSLTLTGTINDDKQQACISPINQVVTDSKVDISIPIITNCNNPQASIQLKDAKGNVLDQKTLSFKTNIQTAAQESNTMMIFIIIGVLIVAGLAVYFIILKKKSNETNIQ